MRITRSVLFVMRKSSLIRRPISHAISLSDNSTNCRFFSAIDTLASIKKSLTFLLPVIPNGVKLSPSFHRRRVIGYVTLSASSRATLSGTLYVIRLSTSHSSKYRTEFPQYARCLPSRTLISQSSLSLMLVITMFRNTEQGHISLHSSRRKLVTNSGSLKKVSLRSTYLMLLIRRLKLVVHIILRPILINIKNCSPP